jgi:hypothetical protein
MHTPTACTTSSSAMTDLSGAQPREALDDRAATPGPTATSDRRAWAKAETFGDFAAICCGQSNLRLLSDPHSFSLTQRMGRIGPLAVAELIVGSDISIERGQRCNSYRVFVPLKGHAVSVHRDLAVTTGPGTVAVLTPEDHTASHWAAGTRMIAVRFDRCVVDDALSDAIGRQVRGPIDFAPVVPITSAATQSWVNMVMLLARQLFDSDNLLNQPLVGLPFVESLVRGFLLTTDHPHREALAKEGEFVAPRTIRTAVEIIEEEAHLPLTLALIAARRWPICVRSGCGEPTRCCWSPIRRRRRSRRSPTIGASPTLAASPARMPCATARRRR